tara:strand:+ start:616 stop:1197 length:582 start_codon:yes stop_codon:yes gene_type:complete
MASQKQELKQAVTAIRDGLKYQIDQSEKMKETAFTARSRDIGITNPDVQKDVSRKQVVRGAIGAAYLATDVALNPQKYTSKAIKNEVSRKTVEEIARQGEKIVNRMLPEGLNLNLDFKSMGLEEARRRPPAVGARYERPVELGRFKGTAGVTGSYDPESKGYRVRAGITGRFAKGGKVKPYAKGGGVRKPKLK